MIDGTLYVTTRVQQHRRARRRDRQGALAVRWRRVRAGPGALGQWTETTRQVYATDVNPQRLEELRGGDSGTHRRRRRRIEPNQSSTRVLRRDLHTSRLSPLRRSIGMNTRPYLRSLTRGRIAIVDFAPDTPDSAPAGRQRPRQRPWRHAGDGHRGARRARLHRRSEGRVDFASPLPRRRKTSVTVTALGAPPRHPRASNESPGSTARWLRSR